LKDIEAVGGSGLFHKFNKSPSALLSSVFPNYEWSPLKFNKFPHKWGSTTYQRLMLNNIAKQLNIKEVSDWYKVSPEVILLICCY
jgi:hypothetical protein